MCTMKWHLLITMNSVLSLCITKTKILLSNSKLSTHIHTLKHACFYIRFTNFITFIEQRNLSIVLLPIVLNKRFKNSWKCIVLIVESGNKTNPNQIIRTQNAMEWILHRRSECRHWRVLCSAHGGQCCPTALWSSYPVRPAHHQAIPTATTRNMAGSDPAAGAYLTQCC